MKPAVSSPARSPLTVSQFFGATLLLAGLVVGCSENPANKSTPAEVSAPAAAPSSKPAANAKTYAFGDDSTIGSVGSKVTGKHTGGFKKFSGQFALAGDSLSGGGHKVVIDMTTTWADNERLAGHLKSPDFFDVAK